MTTAISTAKLFTQLAEPFTAEVLFDQLPDIVFFIKDAEGRYVAVNRTLVERCGLVSKRDLLGKRPSDVLGETLGRSYESQDASVIRSGQPIVDQLELHIVRSRDIGWCLTSKLPLAGKEGKNVGLVGASRDLGLPDVSSDEFEHIADAIDYAERNISSRPTIRELAHIADMSVYQLDRRMQRVFGLTTGQWYLKTRISFASRLLVESDTPIADVAFEAGYADQSSFTRQFRRSTGLSPSQYRNLRR
ncbi:MAG: AraC family transcriptional regulator [Woeseiaceae bacterium]|nr:AraC family transcriptional regulator [Woeseiaceae bacterium]